MTYAVYVALVVSIGVPVAARLVVATWFADHLRPSVAGALIAGWAVVLAGCTTVALGLLVVAGAVLRPAPGDDAVVPAVRVAIGGVAAVAVLVVAARIVVAVVRLVHQYRDAAAAIPADAVAGKPVVVAGAIAPARSLPVCGGHILVGETSWKVLTASERAAVLAHERAHLRCRHHLHLAALSLATAANPLAGRLQPVLEYALERDADERAARDTGDRSAVAHTIAALALRPPIGGPEVTPGVAGSLVVPRVRVLLSGDRAPEDRRGVGAGIGIVLVVAGLIVATVHATMELYAIATGGPC